MHIVQIMLVVGLHGYSGRHAVGGHFRRDRWPGGAVLVDPTDGRDQRTVLGHCLGEPPVRRAGGGLLPVLVWGVPVAPHGIGAVDGQSTVVPVQWPDADETGGARVAAVTGVDALEPTGHRAPSLLARGPRDIPAGSRQLRGGRDPGPPVDRGGGGQPDRQRHRRAQRVGAGVRRADVHGQRRSAGDSRRPRVRALLAPARQPAQQHEVRGRRTVPGSRDPVNLGPAAVRLEHVGTPVLDIRLNVVRSTAVRPVMRGRGRPHRDGAGRQSLRGRQAGLPILGRNGCDRQTA